MELGALKYIAVGLGVGLTVIGASLGLGKIGSSALEGMARQPEASKDLRVSMLLIGALVEGAAIIGLIFCLMTLIL